MSSSYFYASVVHSEDLSTSALLSLRWETVGGAWGEGESRRGEGGRGVGGGRRGGGGEETWASRHWQTTPALPGVHSSLWGQNRTMDSCAFVANQSSR